MIFQGPPYAVLGQGVKGVGDVQGHPHYYHPALLHRPFRQGPDVQDGVHCTPGPAESKLLPVQVGPHFLEVPDESACLFSPATWPPRPADRSADNLMGCPLACSPCEGGPVWPSSILGGKLLP